jgi:hypothetical protein
VRGNSPSMRLITAELIGRRASSAQRRRRLRHEYCFGFGCDPEPFCSVALAAHQAPSVRQRLILIARMSISSVHRGQYPSTSARHLAGHTPGCSKREVCPGWITGDHPESRCA